MNCDYCGSSDVVKKGFRHNKSGKKQKFQCTKCKAWFVYDDGFKRMRKPKEAITRALHQINDGMSLSKVQNHFFQHDNIKVSRAGILYWIKKDDPNGIIPENPTQNPQFLLWEKPVRDWVLTQKIKEETLFDIPQDSDN